MNNWKDVWSRRTFEPNADIHTSLIKANGFDTGYGDYDSASFHKLVLDAARRVNLLDSDIVLDLGCGSGAFIYSLINISSCKCIGVDYSQPLIDIAKEHIPNVDFICSDAIDFTIDFDSVDVVFSHGVFIYFPNHQYVANVIKKLGALIKKGGRLCLLDLNDEDKISDFHKVRSSKFSSIDEYAAHYENLDQLFLSKIYIKELLEANGFHNICFFPHAHPDYFNSKYRFNVMACK